MARFNGVCGFCSTGRHEQCARATAHYDKLWKCPCDQTPTCGINATPRCTTCKSEENVNPDTWRCNDLRACYDTVQARLKSNPTIQMITELRGRATMAEQAKATETAEKVKAAKVKKTCNCGCGTETYAKFAPGHDARMVAAFKKDVLAGKIREAEALAKTKELGSDALATKLQRGIALERAATEKRAAAAKAKAEEKAKADAEKAQAAAEKKAETKADKAKPAA